MKGTNEKVRKILKNKPENLKEMTGLATRAERCIKNEGTAADLGWMDRKLDGSKGEQKEEKRILNNIRMEK